MKRTFEYCALRYLLLWVQAERDLHNIMKNSPSASDLRNSLHNFRVSRTFKGIKDKAGIVLNALNEVGASNVLSSIEMVNELAARFSSEFNQTNLSAASKLLWFRYRSPFVIYDDRANRALKQLGHKFDKRSYEEYASAWNVAYNQSRGEVFAAAGLIPSLHPFFADSIDSPSLELLAREPWFLERVFDIYLWENGGKPKRLGGETGVVGPKRGKVH